MKKLKVRLFGAFRKYIPGGELELEVPEKILVREVKSLLAQNLHLYDFTEAQLVYDSAVATDDRVLQLDEEVMDSQIAILPPVCGG